MLAPLLTLKKRSSLRLNQGSRSKICSNFVRSIACGTHQLEYGSLDAVLRCIADWQIVNFFVMNCDRQRIFAPYDGGVDAILKDAEERDEFKSKYKGWLSSHPQGL